MPDATERDLDKAEAHLYPVREREWSPAADALRRTPARTTATTEHGRAIMVTCDGMLGRGCDALISGGTCGKCGGKGRLMLRC